MAANNSINIPPLSSSTSDQTQLVREDEAITRRSANFHPSIWGNFFLSYASPQKEDGGDTQEVKEHQQLKEAVKTMFLETHHPQKLELMINNIQRLGVGYRFEKEIEATLERIYEVYDDLNAKDVMENNDLYAVSLRFRLLRQQGYFVSSKRPKHNCEEGHNGVDCKHAQRIGPPIWLVEGVANKS